MVVVAVVGLASEGGRGGREARFFFSGKRMAAETRAGMEGTPSYVSAIGFWECAPGGGVSVALWSVGIGVYSHLVLDVFPCCDCVDWG